MFDIRLLKMFDINYIRGDTGTYRSCKGCGEWFSSGALDYCPNCREKKKILEGLREKRPVTIMKFVDQSSFH